MNLHVNKEENKVSQINIDLSNSADGRTDHKETDELSRSKSSENELVKDEDTEPEIQHPISEGDSEKPNPLEETKKETKRRAKNKFKEKMQNSNGVIATKWKNGKYYCGSNINCKKLSKNFPVKWEEKNGLNCLSCMQLDLDARNIEMLAVVNEMGNISMFDYDTAKFYWGIKLSPRKQCDQQLQCRPWKRLKLILEDCDYNPELHPYFDLIIPEALKNVIGKQDEDK